MIVKIRVEDFAAYYLSYEGIMKKIGYCFKVKNSRFWLDVIEKSKIKDELPERYKEDILTMVDKLFGISENFIREFPMGRFRTWEDVCYYVREWLTSEMIK
ncbi:hypothetical protein M0R19_09210 [Candidatus Pacearchaeota archaeon]|nr:hypothetical protein [Candidatus Pacearchaeota archaeon]